MAAFQIRSCLTRQFQWMSECRTDRELPELIYNGADNVLLDTVQQLWMINFNIGCEMYIQPKKARLCNNYS